MSLTVKCKKRIDSNKSNFFSIVRLGDITVVTFMITAMFPYGTVWNSFTGEQITAFRLILTTITLIAVVIKFKNLKIDKVGFIAALYAGLVILQALLSPIGPGSSVTRGLLGLLVFAVPFMFAKRYGKSNLISILFILFLIAAIIMNGVSLLSNGQGFLVAENAYIFSSNYLLGNKFILSYTNMLLLALYAYRAKSTVRIILVGIIVTIACLIANCSTGVIGTIVMIICIILPNINIHIISKKWLIPAIIVTMAIIAVAASWIMTLPAVQAFTVGVLGETPDFSGRLPIYSQIMDWFLVHPFFGYGSTAAANSIVVLNNGAADCQEGLFQILLSNGLVGGIIFLMLCVASLSNFTNNDNRTRGVFAYLVAMGLISLVEINLSYFFLLGLSLMHILSMNSR